MQILVPAIQMAAQLHVIHTVNRCDMMWLLRALFLILFTLKVTDSISISWGLIVLPLFPDLFLLCLPLLILGVGFVILGILELRKKLYKE